jgi:hypothetical protein
MNTSRSLARAGLAVAALLASAATSFAKDPDIGGYFVGVDGLASIATGTFAGLANPNYQRLTFLYAHTYEDTPASNHYHSKAIYRYDPASTFASPVVQQSPSNYVPEGAIAPLTLSLAAGGAYDGKLVSAPLPEADPRHGFSFTTIEDTGALAGFGPTAPETILFNSSGGRWNGALTGADVHIVLVGLTAGLNVGVGLDLNAFENPGDDFHLADSFSFTPTFWTDFNATPGLYTAQFMLTDEEGIFGDSGTFEFRFEVAAAPIPEPSTYAALAGLGMLGFAVLRRRRN